MDFLNGDYEQVLGSNEAEFALAWAALRKALPSWTQVKITLRRKNGQVLVQVGNISRTGTTEAEALQAVAKALTRQ